MIKVALLGCGRLGKIIARGLSEGKVENCQLIGILERDKEKAATFPQLYGCEGYQQLEDVLALKPEYFIDASNADTVKECAERILSAGCDMICLSASAFQDQEFCQRVRQTAQEHHTQVHLASGAVGGFDVIAAAMLYGPVQVTLTQRKYPPESPKCPPGFRGMPGEYEGGAWDAVSNYPERLNIAAATSVVCQDWQNTKVRLEPIPDEEFMSFALDVTGDFGKAHIFLQQGSPAHIVPGPDLAAWSTLATLRRLTSPITF